MLYNPTALTNSNHGLSRLGRHALAEVQAELEPFLTFKERSAEIPIFNLDALQLKIPFTAVENIYNWKIRAFAAALRSLSQQKILSKVGRQSIQITPKILGVRACRTTGQFVVDIDPQSVAQTISVAKGYGKVDIEEFRRLKRKCSQKAYELCCNFERSGGTRLGITTICNMFGIKTNIISDLRVALDAAIAEMKGKTGCSFEYSFEKASNQTGRGRKAYSHIQIRVKFAKTIKHATMPETLPINANMQAIITHHLGRPKARYIEQCFSNPIERGVLAKKIMAAHQQYSTAPEKLFRYIINIMLT